MSTWGLSGTVPLADFAEDPEDLIYKYIGNNWSITTPTHLNKTSIFQTTVQANMINRPNPGVPIWIWVRHAELQSGRDIFGSTVGRNGLIQHNHIFEINIMTTRMLQGLTFPDLGILSREIKRLLYQYDGQIPGIQHFVNFRMFPTVDATDWGEDWTGTFRVSCATMAQYQLYSTV